MVMVSIVADANGLQSSWYCYYPWRGLVITGWFVMPAPNQAVTLVFTRGSPPPCRDGYEGTRAIGIRVCVRAHRMQDPNLGLILLC